MIGKNECSSAEATEPMGLSFTDDESPVTTSLNPSKSIELNCDDIEKKLKEIEERLGDYRLQQSPTFRQNREDKSTMMSNRIYDTRSILEHPPSPDRTASGGASSSNSTATMSLTYSGEMSETSKKIWDMHHSVELKKNIPQISDTFSIEICDNDDDDDDSIPLIKKQGKEQEERDDYLSSSGAEISGINKVVTLPKTAAPLLVENKPQLSNRSSDEPNKTDQQEIEKTEPASKPENDTECLIQVDDSGTVELKSNELSLLKETDGTTTAAGDQTFKTDGVESELKFKDVVPHEDEESLLPKRDLFDGLLEVKLSQEDRIRMYTSGSVDDESDPPSVVLSSHGSVSGENDQEDQYDTVPDDQLESFLIESNGGDNMGETIHQSEDLVVENTITATETCSPCKEWFSIFFGEVDNEQPAVVSNKDLNTDIEEKTITPNSSLVIGQPKEEANDNLEVTKEEETIVTMKPTEATVSEGKDEIEAVGQRGISINPEKESEDNTFDFSDSFSIDGPLPNSFDSGDDETELEKGETEQTIEELCLLKETFVQPKEKRNDPPEQTTIINKKSVFGTETSPGITNFSSMDVGLVEFEPWDDSVWKIPPTESSGNSNVVETITLSPPTEERSRPETNSAISRGRKKQTTFLPPPPEAKWNAWLEEKNTMKQAIDLFHHTGKNKNEEASEQDLVPSLHSARSTEFPRNITSTKALPLGSAPRSVPLKSSRNLDECKFDHEEFPTIESFPSDEGGMLYKERYDIFPISKKGEA